MHGLGPSITFTFFPLWLRILVVAICMILMYHLVRKMENHISRYVGVSLHHMSLQLQGIWEHPTTVFNLKISKIKQTCTTKRRAMLTQEVTGY